MHHSVGRQPLVPASHHASSSIESPSHTNTHTIKCAGKWYAVVNRCFMPTVDASSAFSWFQNFRPWSVVITDGGNGQYVMPSYHVHDVHSTKQCSSACTKSIPRWYHGDLIGVRCSSGFSWSIFGFLCWQGSHCLSCKESCMIVIMMAIGSVQNKITQPVLHSIAK